MSSQVLRAAYISDDLFRFAIHSAESTAFLIANEGRELGSKIASPQREGERWLRACNAGSDNRIELRRSHFLNEVNFRPTNLLQHLAGRGCRLEVPREQPPFRRRSADGNARGPFPP